MALAIYGSTISTSTSFSHDSGSGSDRLLIVRVCGHRTAAWTVDAVTYNGVSLTKFTDGSIGYNYGDSQWIRVEYWYLVNPASGSNTVAITVSDAPGRPGYIATTYTGADGIGTAYATTSGNPSSVSMNIATSASTSLIDGCWQGQEQRGVTLGGGLTLLARVGSEGSSTFSTWAGYESASGGTDTWGTLTLASSVRSAAAVIEIKEKAAGGLTATGIATGVPTVGSPVLNQVHSLTATGIDTGAPTVGIPSTSVAFELTAEGVTTGTPTLGEPAINQTHILSASGVSTDTPTTGEPAITQTHALVADGIVTGAPTTGTPTLGSIAGVDDLLADGIVTGSPAVGTPAIAQAHTLAATGIVTGAPTTGAPEIGQVHVITASGVTTGTPDLGQPVITQTQLLTAIGIAVGAPTLGTPSLAMLILPLGLAAV